MPTMSASFAQRLELKVGKVLAGHHSTLVYAYFRQGEGGALSD
jgi:hypothetical protein